MAPPATKSHKHFQVERVNLVTTSIHKRDWTLKHAKHCVREKREAYGQPKSIFSSRERKKILLKGLIFHVTIIAGLNRMFFQFWGCNHSLKHVLIEKASWESLIILTFFTWWKGQLFYFILCKITVIGVWPFWYGLLRLHCWIFSQNQLF